MRDEVVSRKGDDHPFWYGRVGKYDCTITGGKASSNRNSSRTETIIGPPMETTAPPAPAPTRETREGEGEGDLLLTKAISFRPPPKMPSYVSSDGLLNKCDVLKLAIRWAHCLYPTCLLLAQGLGFKNSSYYESIRKLGL